MQAGACDFLTVPVSLAKLLTLLAGPLGSNRREASTDTRKNACIGMATIPSSPGWGISPTLLGIYPHTPRSNLNTSIWINQITNGMAFALIRYRLQSLETDLKPA